MHGCQASMAASLSAVGGGKAGAGGSPAPEGAVRGPDAHGGHNDQHIASNVVAGDGRRHASAPAGPSILRCLRNEGCCSH